MLTGGARSWPPARTVAQAAAVVMLVVAGFVLLLGMGDALLSLLLGWVLATAVAPLVARLRRWHVPRWLAGAFVFTALGALLVGALILVAPVVIHQASAIAARMPAFCHDIAEQASRSRSDVLARFARTVLPRACGFVPTGSPVSPSTILSEGARYIDWFRSALWAALGTLALGYFWSVERAVVVRAFLFALSPVRRERVRSFLVRAEDGVGAFVRGQAVISAVVFVVTLMTYRSLGLESSLALSTLAGILEIVPVLGPLVALVVAVFSALTTRPELAIAVVVVAVALRLVVDYVLMPVLMGRSCGVNPFLLLVVLIAMGSRGGIAGAMVAVPLAAVVQLAFDEILGRRTSHAHAPPRERDQIGLLEWEAGALSQAVRRVARRQGDTPRPAIESEVEDEIEALAESVRALSADRRAVPELAPQEELR